MMETAHPQTLYQQDLVAWCDDTVAKLKAGNFADIDIDSLIEEIEGLAGRDRRELENRLEVLLNHLLKRLYVDSPNDYRSWELTISGSADMNENSEGSCKNCLSNLPVCEITGKTCSLNSGPMPCPTPEKIIPKPSFLINGN